MDKVDLGEREAIVRWLRREALTFRGLALNYGKRGLFAVANSYQLQELHCSATADAIERGDHLTNPGATNEG